MARTRAPDRAAAVRAFTAALDRLEASVRPFAQGPVAARNCLRRSVDPSRVARVTNLAQLLFDEEAFADWLLLETALGGNEGPGNIGQDTALGGEDSEDG